MEDERPGEIRIRINGAQQMWTYLTIEPHLRNDKIRPVLRVVKDVVPPMSEDETLPSPPRPRTRRVTRRDRSTYRVDVDPIYTTTLHPVRLIDDFTILEQKVLYIFRDSVERYDTSIGGPGDEQLRIYNCNGDYRDRPHSAGIKVGLTQGTAFTRLDSVARRHIDESIERIIDMIHMLKYRKIRYLSIRGTLVIPEGIDVLLEIDDDEEYDFVVHYLPAFGNDVSIEIRTYIRDSLRRIRDVPFSV
jgi:hypothetical protein